MQPNYSLNVIFVFGFESIRQDTDDSQQLVDLPARQRRWKVAKTASIAFDRRENIKVLSDNVRWLGSFIVHRVVDQ